MLYKFKKVNVFAIVVDIIKIFILACGVVLIIRFLIPEKDVYKAILGTSVEKEICKKLVLVNFLFLVEIKVIYEILINTRWFCGNVTIVKKTESIDAKAISSDTCDNNNAKSEYERKIDAIHEAGHAIMAYIQKVDIVCVNMNSERPHVTTANMFGNRENLKKLILIKYAGAAAEEIVCGEFCIGAMNGDINDYDSATDLIKKYIVMSNPNVSKSLLTEELAEQIIEVSKNLYNEAKRMLSEHKEMIEQLSKELLKNSFFTKNEINALMEDVTFKLLPDTGN